ncbi:hypothetical protein ABB37_06505 [Leptomonas pyrrhocoris]|uniref:Calcium uniporter protein C-terminal domain-containing protein n=1 Tax=Leptomonas pyrrhocoris TaxID=157538 RepID=A0A0M9FXZ9_LEPPY|nr:hypothetical protein ABB37_06505 [Leptomonas pyrrhocoris]KPA78395.1 hypothetical protein ABB37_06505 [Leptomonas pyrrhocoris]|eukprot:XP_015656834.1 hypothetical protein ABB37_06505 [Leptomonas pyrrhocoris]
MLTKVFLRKTLFARAAINLCDKKIVVRDDFLAMLINGKYTPPQFRMTHREAAEYLDVLKRSKMVVEVGDYVYSDPQNVVDAVHLKGGLPLVSSVSHDLEDTRRTLALALAESHERSSPKVEKAVRREKEFWAFTALGSGIQMLVLSYLTFQVYGWDVMEPITFFVTTTTALCSFAYFLFFRAEHSYEHVDDSLLPYRLSKELGNSQVAAGKMIRNIQLSQELEQVVSKRNNRASKLIAEALKR